jgi:DNA polymerase/3'-5' exonuclease PolX
MSTNSDAADAFREIADLLDVLGERFKPEAYRRASRSLDSLTEDLRAIAQRDELRSIPGVGDAIEEKIREFLSTGRIDYLERLRKEIPPGLLEILRLPGLGPKTARRFWVELGIEGPAELATAIDAGRLSGVKGFGPKKIEQIRAALAAAKGSAPSARMPIETAYPIAHRLLEGLRAAAAVEQLEVAGSFRRCRETVGDLDLLVTSAEPENVFEVFSHLPEVREVRLRGPTKETVLLGNGLQVDLRVVEPAAFGAALLYFTGSKDHNVHLRTIARDRGLKINEYGIFRGDDRVGGRTEEEMYAALDLEWVPPEIREDRGEVDQAARGKLPHLVEPGDVAGDLHVHLPEGATADALDRLAADARRLRFGYLGIVVGGTREDGSSFEMPSPVLERVGRLGGRGLTVGRAVELAATPARTPDPLPVHEFTVLRPTREAPEPPETPPTKGASPLYLAHVGGEESARRWIAWARGTHASIEVGPGPERVDSVGARTALETGMALTVATGVGREPEDPTAAISLGFARRAGAEKPSVRNAAETATVTRSWSAGRSGRTPTGS